MFLIDECIFSHWCGHAASPVRATKQMAGLSHPPSSNSHGPASGEKLYSTKFFQSSYLSDV
jgi:hypothetical protein